MKFSEVKDYKFTFIDLFAGIGGTRLAFENLGGKCLFASEIDYFANQTYFDNFGVIPFGDITKIHEQSIPEHDILVAGFPCPSFSTAGKRGRFDDTRGTLFSEIDRIIKAKRPKAFFLENVKGLLSHDSGRTIETILKTLREDLGYYVMEPKIINAADFGVPQNRERLYIVGFNKELNISQFSFPTPLKDKVVFEDIKEKNPVSPKYYLTEDQLEKLRNQRYQSIQVINEDGMANAIVSGSMGRERNLVVDTRVKVSTLVPTTKSKINKESIRRLTPRECARLDGFPENFEITIPDEQAYRLLGNSVTVPAVKAIGEQLVNLVTGKNVAKNKKQQIKSKGNDSKKIGTLKYNKGEWSEVYTVLKLLTEGKLYSVDDNGGKDFPLIKISRKEDEENIYDYYFGENIRIIDRNKDQIVLELPAKVFKDMSEKLLQDIINGQGSSFPVSAEVEQFLNKIFIKRIKEKSSKKGDITVVIQKDNEECPLKFSIKSKVGKKATLVNPSKRTHFIYKLTGEAPFSENFVDRINENESTKDRINEIEKLGYKLKFDKMNSDTYLANLQMIDHSLQLIFSKFLMYFFKKECKHPQIVKMIQHLENNNPSEFTTILPVNRDNMKLFLEASALGMVPKEEWNGKYDADGGLIVVNKDGKIVAYLLQNKNVLREYLFKNTRFDSPDRKKYDYGYVYKQRNDMFINLCLQIRF